MNIQQIRYVAEAAKEGSLTAVADKLYVTEPTVSLQIRKLEAELDVRLFTRTTRSVVLTDEGRIFLENALPVISAYDHLAETMQNIAAHKNSRINVMMTASENMGDIMGFVREFHEESGIDVALSSGTETELRRDIRAGRLDMIITKLSHGRESSYNTTYTYPKSEYNIYVLRKLPLNVIASSGSYPGKSAISVKDLRDAPIVCDAPDSAMERWIKSEYSAMGIAPKITLYASNPEVIFAAAANNMGISFADDSICNHYMGSYDFRSIPMTPAHFNDLCLIIPNGRKLSEHHRRFRDGLIEYYKE